MRSRDASRACAVAGHCRQARVAQASPPVPPRPARLGQHRICKEWAATRLRRYNFRHHAITVRDQYGFAASREADIFAKFVFEDLQTH